MFLLASQWEVVACLAWELHTKTYDVLSDTSYIHDDQLKSLDGTTECLMSYNCLMDPLLEMAVVACSVLNQGGTP